MNKDGIPGPGQYNSNSFIGKAPKYSMASKSGGVDMSKYVVSPGPGMYTPTNNHLTKSSSYSMLSRPNSSTKAYVTPGPGNYNIRTDKGMQVPSYKYLLSLISGSVQKKRTGYFPLKVSTYQGQEIIIQLKALVKQRRNFLLVKKCELIEGDQ
jgi:hypothetical protein